MNFQIRRGFTLVELLVVIAIIGVLAGLLLPAINQAREASRKTSCSSNIRQLALASMQYEQSFKRLVAFDSQYYMQPGWSGFPERQSVWSGFIALLPHLDEGPLYTALHTGTTGRMRGIDRVWGPYGSVASTAPANFQVDDPRWPWDAAYPPNRTQVGVFRCPSDPGRFNPAGIGHEVVARTNYAFCVGDNQFGQGTQNGPVLDTEVTRNVFQRGMFFDLSAITDGASNTIMFGEIATAETRSEFANLPPLNEADAKVQGRAHFSLGYQSLRTARGIDVAQCRATAVGGRYAGNQRVTGRIGIRVWDVRPTYTSFATINSPNQASCSPTDDPWGEGDGIYTSASYHYGGAHVVTFDVSVKFISDGISTQDSRPQFMNNLNEYYSPGRVSIGGIWRTTPNWQGASPFGVWGALGTRCGSETNLERPE